MIAEESPPEKDSPAATPGYEEKYNETNQNYSRNLHQDAPVCQELGAELPPIISVQDLKTKLIEPPKIIGPICECPDCGGEQAEPCEIEWYRDKNPDWQPGEACSCEFDRDGFIGAFRSANHPLAQALLSKLDQNPDILDRLEKWVEREKAKEQSESSEPEPDVDDFPQIRESFSALEAAALIEPEELVEGLVHSFSKTVFGGASKSKKTWLMMDLALSLAGGTPFQGRKTKKCKVLFINLELMEYFFRFRGRKIRDDKALSLEEFDSNYHSLTLRGYCEDIKTLIPKLRKRLVGKQYDVIFVDPIYKLMGGRDENSAGDIGVLLNELEKFSVNSKAAIIYAAHFPKGNAARKTAIDRISGSGVYARDADSLILLTEHQAEKCYTVDIIPRNFADQTSYVVQWRGFRFHKVNLNPKDLKGNNAASKKSKWQPIDLLRLISEKPLRNKEMQEAAKGAGGMSESQFDALLRQCKESALVDLDESTRQYSPSIIGRSMLDATGRHS